jgi:hypothetical protein
MARSKIRIERDGLTEQRLGGFGFFAPGPVQVPEAALIGLPGVKAFWRLA